MQEVLHLLHVDNRMTPEEIEHFTVVAAGDTIDVTGRDGSLAPVERLLTWRGTSPFLVPAVPSGRRGMPALWTKWILDQTDTLSDKALREGLKAAHFAVASLGLPVSFAAGGWRWSFRTRVVGSLLRSDPTSGRSIRTTCRIARRSCPHG
jgi:hypothetical protein